jgi:DNA-binding transcriptional LysR family regulator
MASPRPQSLAQASHYRPPELLRDIRLLDLLELCGTTSQASRLLGLSQPTVSRRYHRLRQDLDLVRERYPLWSCGYGTTPTLRLLRLGCRAHRLAAGVARIGSDLLHHPLLTRCPWLLPTPQRFRAAANWLELVRQGVLDGALISGLELEEAEGVNHQELELLPLGELPLALAFCPEAPVLVGSPAGGRVEEVLVPDRGVAPGLRRLLRELGLPLRSGGNSLQTPDDWIGRIQGNALALVVPDREADTWASLQRWPLGNGPRASRPISPVWLALPADWQEHQVLRHTARELGQCCATVPSSHGD